MLEQPKQRREPPAKILFVDDDGDLDDVCQALASYGHEVIVGQVWHRLQHLLWAGQPDLLIVNPDRLGADSGRVQSVLCHVSPMPVVIFTACADDQSMINWYQWGAADYVVKPTNPAVLLCRVNAILRRVRSQPRDAPTPTLLRMPGAIFDTGLNEIVHSTGVRVKLTRVQGQILRLLLLHEGQVFSAERIKIHIAGYEDKCQVSVIKSHIQHLREKISALPESQPLIYTIPGIGYVLSHRLDPGTMRHPSHGSRTKEDTREK
jgi:two-component system, OmpR family, response regulator RstA